MSIAIKWAGEKGALSKRQLVREAREPAVGVGGRTFSIATFLDRVQLTASEKSVLIA